MGVRISLKAARVNANMTQKEAAEKLGVDRLTLLKWENGVTQPARATVIGMADVYGIPVENIFLPSDLT